MGAYLDTVLPIYGRDFADWWRDRLRPEMERNFVYLEERLDATEGTTLAEVACLAGRLRAALPVRPELVRIEDAQPDRLVAVVDDVHAGIVGGDRLRLIAIDAAFRMIRGERAERRAHVLETEPRARERGGIGLHAHGRLLPGADEHLPHARHLRDLLRQDRIGGVKDLRERQCF